MALKVHGKLFEKCPRCGCPAEEMRVADADPPKEGEVCVDGLNVTGKVECPRCGWTAPIGKMTLEYETMSDPGDAMIDVG